MKNSMRHLKIKINFLFAALMLMLAASSSVQAQTFKAHYNTAITSNTNGFYDYLPQGYSSTGSTYYPLLIFIHGMGEYGSGSTTSLPAILKHGTPRYINEGIFPTSFSVDGKTFKFIVIAPQWKSQASTSNVNSLIDYAISHYKVDQKRIYITGLSAGGGVVENVASNLTVGKRIAAAVEFCGTTNASSTGAANIITNNVAFWGLHNDYDNIVPSSKTKNWANYILAKKSTFPAKKTIFNATGHNCWYTPYHATWKDASGLSIYQWMLKFARGTVSTSTNIAPVANAGSNKSITLPTNYVTLAGSGTDADGSIAAYKWTKVSGPSSYSFSTTTSASTTVKSLLAGTYIFRLTVTDSKGATAYDDVTVVVNSSNVAPKANAGSDKTITLPTNYVTLYGSGSDGDGSISKYFWSKISGPSSYAFSSTSTASTKVSGLVAGTYTFRLTVTDNKGATAYDNVNVVVNSSTTTTSTTSYKVEAESYTDMKGVQKEVTKDAGGGYDVGYIDQYDWMYYVRSIGTTGNYTFGFRVATPSTGAKFEVYDTYGGVKTKVATVTVPNTGGYQTWANVYATISLKAGTHYLTLYSIGTYRWNINYFQYKLASTTTSTALATDATAVVEEGTTTTSALSVSPNPFTDKFVLQVNNPYTGTMKVQIVDQSGVVRKEYLVAKNATGSMQTYLSAGTLAAGTYFMKVQLDTWTQSTKVVKL